MAQDQVEVMAALGLTGSWRPATIAAPASCTACASTIRTRSSAPPILDIIPQHHLFNNVTRQWATASWHWFFMIQPCDMPERLMSADPDFFITKKLSKTKQGLSFFGPEALEEYKRCFRNPATVHAMCEDYRATATVDLAMDTADFAAGRRVGCPVLLLWGATGAVGRNHKPAEVWTQYASNIVGAQALPCGHYLSEEAPEETYQALRAFFRSRT